MIYFFIFCLAAVGLLTLYELSGDRATFTGIVSTKQLRHLEGKPDLFWVEVWTGEIVGVVFYDLFVDAPVFNRLWEGDRITFEAKKGRLTSYLYQRKLVS